MRQSCGAGLGWAVRLTKLTVLDKLGRCCVWDVLDQRNGLLTADAALRRRTSAGGSAEHVQPQLMAWVAMHGSQRMCQHSRTPLKKLQVQGSVTRPSQV